MKRIISIFLSLLMLISSSGVAMTTHYCGGYAMDSEIALGHVHLNCGMEEGQKASCSNDDQSFHMQEADCCDNESIAAETDTHNVQKLLNTPDLTFVATIATAFLIHPILPAEKQIHIIDYSPPLLEQEISILYQTFLL